MWHLLLAIAAEEQTVSRRHGRVVSVLEPQWAVVAAQLAQKQVVWQSHRYAVNAERLVQLVRLRPYSVHVVTGQPLLADPADSEVIHLVHITPMVFFKTKIIKLYTVYKTFISEKWISIVWKYVSIVEARLLLICVITARICNRSKGPSSLINIYQFEPEMGL